MRAAAVVAVLLVLGGVAVMVLGTSAAPLSRTCAADMPVAACDGAVAAVLRRGLPALHPLILSTRVDAMA